MTKIIDIEKYKKEKEIGKIRAEHYFTLDEVEEIAWQCLQSVMSEEELQEISWRLEQLTKENDGNTK